MQHFGHSLVTGLQSCAIDLIESLRLAVYAGFSKRIMEIYRRDGMDLGTATIFKFLLEFFS